MNPSDFFVDPQQAAGINKAADVYEKEADHNLWSASFFRAVSETRTRDPQLGKLMLYQLSYYRLCAAPANGAFYSAAQI